MYAIVDIETTGGHANANGITEIAIVLHDGNKIIKKYQTLINPEIPIPIYISALTGINDEMVKLAPTFNKVAAEIFELLQDSIFVAHNVNFDYSFIRHHLLKCGFDLQLKKLCTVRLSRKLLPGYASYSLGKLCNCLGIQNSARHRALGDAEATCQLFKILLEKDSENYIDSFLKKNSKEQQLPIHLNKDQIDNLPNCPGVYYFKDKLGKAIYVGKAINIKKRVLSHFSGNNSGKQRQEFLRNIYSISYQICGTELMALILEASEIKRLWPNNNRALKRFELSFGLFTYEDQKGYTRLIIDKKTKLNCPIYSFSNLSEGHNLLKLLIKEFQLCSKLCFVQRNTEDCIGIKENTCNGACKGAEDPITYNLRLQKALQSLKISLPTFALLDAGRNANENSIVLMENGSLKGMGYVSKNEEIGELDKLREHIDPFMSNDYIKNLILVFANKYPEKLIYFN